MKKKPLHMMGRCFQCKWPQVGAWELQEFSSRKPDQGTAASNHVPETEHNSKSQLKRAWPYQYENSCAILEKELL
jgi:hypothetical protein